jgi:hypothetical protein
MKTIDPDKLIEANATEDDAPKRTISRKTVKW